MQQVLAQGREFLSEPEAKAEHEGRTRLRASLRRFLGREVPLRPDADAAAALGACLHHLGKSSSRLVLVSMEDLWGETAPQNVPGKVAAQALDRAGRPRGSAWSGPP